MARAKLTKKKKSMEFESIGRGKLRVSLPDYMHNKRYAQVLVIIVGDIRRTCW
jgi:hypothetical protein